jgi:hypothetical protein
MHIFFIPHPAKFDTHTHPITFINEKYFVGFEMRGFFQFKHTPRDGKTKKQLKLLYSMEVGLQTTINQ